MTTPTNISPKPTNTSKKMLLAFHLLLLVYPVLYFMQQNVAEFALHTYLNTAIYIVLYAILPSIIYIFVLKYDKKWLHIIYLTVLSFAMYVVLRVTLCRIYPLTAFPATFTILIVSYLLYYTNHLKQANLILGLMTIFSVMSYAHQLLFYSDLNMPKKYPEMSTKPNIYMLILESYHGNEALKKIYEYDNTPFLNDLTDLGFTIYPNIYATRPLTRLSLISVLTLANSPEIEKKEHLLSPCLSGKAPCYIMSTLKRNGYKTKTKFANSYLMAKDYQQTKAKYKLGCNTLFSEYYIKFFSKCYIRNTQKYKVVDDFNLELIDTINNLKAENSPYMFITKIGGITETQSTYKGGLAHIPNFYLHSNQIERIPKFKKTYITELQKENKFLKELIAVINKKDPNALIIMFGDHGAHLYETYQDKETRLSFGISNDDYIMDLFNVMVAVRYPNGLKSTKSWHYLPELFSVIFDTLGSPLDNLKIEPFYYGYKNEPYSTDKNAKE